MVHVLVGQLRDPIGERGREQHPEALLHRRHLAEQIADVLDEAEIEHAIGLVEHHHLDALEVEDMLLVVVDQASRRTDQDVDPARQFVALLLIAGAAIDHGRAQTRVLGQRQGVLVDLHRQLARRRQHQRPWATATSGGSGRRGQRLRRRLGFDRGHRLGRFGLRRVVRRDGRRLRDRRRFRHGFRRLMQQTLHQRHQEGRRLAGAGLGLSGDVLALEGDRQGFGLDGRAMGEAGLGETGEDPGIERETVEAGRGQMCVGHEAIGERPGWPAERFRSLADGKACKLPSLWIK